MQVLDETIHHRSQKLPTKDDEQIAVKNDRRHVVLLETFKCSNN